MSRGRGGTAREHYQRHPRPYLQAKESNHRPDPVPTYLRGSPQHGPLPTYYNTSLHPVVPQQPLEHSFLPSCPPSAHHRKDQIPPKPGESSNSVSAPDSFHYQQVEFLRGKNFEPPQFTARPPSSYQLQPGYNYYPRPRSSPRGRGLYCQDQCLPSVRHPRVPPDPRLLHENHLQDPEVPFSRQQRAQADTLAAGFQHLSLHQRWPNRGGDRFSRYSAANFSPVKVISFTPDIQELVHRALLALNPSDRVSAKFLAKKLHLPKPIVNKALYSLEHTQKASKQSLSPPLWTAYRELLYQDSVLESLASHVTVEQSSDTESYSCSSTVSSDSEDSKAAEHQHPITPSSPDQEHTRSTMPEQKELVLHYLLNSGEATALCIAKNLGFKTAKQINPTLYTLEKQGDVIKNGEVTPPTWELATHRRERMERSLKAAKSASTSEVKMEVENERDASTLLPPTALQPTPEVDCWSPRQDYNEQVA